MQTVFVADSVLDIAALHVMLQVGDAAGIAVVVMAVVGMPVDLIATVDVLGIVIANVEVLVMDVVDVMVAATAEVRVLLIAEVDATMVVKPLVCLRVAMVVLRGVRQHATGVVLL